MTASAMAVLLCEAQAVAQGTAEKLFENDRVLIWSLVSGAAVPCIDGPRRDIIIELK